MSFLTPSTGEILDRITILEIKIEAYKKKKKDSTRLGHEKSELEAYFKDHLFDVTIEEELKYFREVLKETNIDIWERIDNTVALELNTENFIRLATLAKLTVTLNERRTNTMRKIDELYGESLEEKIF